MLNYYKRLGNINAATEAVYELLNEANGISDLIAHYNALKEEEKAHADPKDFMLEGTKRLSL
ncbi:MAG: hypothetical protein ACP5HW_03805 [Candidatus Micrarchaeia archaeon]